MEHASERRIGELDVIHGAVEAFDRSMVHLLVKAVAAVHANHGGLVAVLFAVGQWTAPGLAPVRRESLCVLWVEAMTERVRDNFIFHDPFVPRTGETQDTRGTAEGFEQGESWHDC